MSCFTFQNTDILDFDDFGVDMYHVPGATLCSSNLDDDKNTCILDDTSNIGIARYEVLFLFILFLDLDS